MGMLEDTHPDYMLYQHFSEPSDFGFSGVARSRTWVMAAHRDRTVVKEDPFEILNAIKQACQLPGFQTTITDYLVASKGEILLEANELAERRKINFNVDCSNLNLEGLLLPRELETVLTLNARYLLKYQKQPWENPELVYYLGDSASYGNSWSACSGKIPTFRTNSSHGIFWMPSKGRWLTSRERLTAMGWPCVHESAAAMGVPMFGALDPKRASDLVGNAMHWQTAGIMQLVCLTCFGPSTPNIL